MLHLKRIIIDYGFIFQRWITALWQEAHSPAQGWISDLAGKLYARVPVIFRNNKITHGVKTLFVCKKVIGLIRRDVMRAIRGNSVYIKVFDYIKKYLVYIAYATTCILGYMAILPLGWLQLVIFVALGVITISYVQSNIKTQEEDIIHMNIILFYLNGSCLLAFFFDYIWGLL